jgi:transposase-like protein
MTTVAEVQVQIKRIWHSSFQNELDNALEANLRQSTLVGVRATLEAALQEELSAELGFNHYVRLPSGRKPIQQHRSGFFRRQVLTTYGRIPDLRVPKLRSGNAERQWRILVRYQQSMQSVLDRLLYLYSMGLSLRDLQETLYLFMGQALSREAVNRVTLAAQERMDAWRRQRLAETPPVIIIDGVWVEILYPTGDLWTDRSGHHRQKRRGQKRVILAALAVFPDGRHYLLHYEVAEDENAKTWTAFFQHLLDRGLDPQAVQVVACDGSNGVVEALSARLPQAKLQRCTVHKVRGFERYLTYKDLPTTDAQTGQFLTEAAARQQRYQTMKTEALDIFEAPTQGEAEQRLAGFVAQWESLEPKAVHNFTWGLKRCFTFYQLDAALHPLVRSTNLLERFFREFRNKADEIGAFPNEDSCLTVFHLVMVREHAKHNRVDFAKTG